MRVSTDVCHWTYRVDIELRDRTDGKETLHLLSQHRLPGVKLEEEVGDSCLARFQRAHLCDLVEVKEQ